MHSPKKSRQELCQQISELFGQMTGLVWSHQPTMLGDMIVSSEIADPSMLGSIELLFEEQVGFSCFQKGLIVKHSYHAGEKSVAYFEVQPAFDCGYYEQIQRFYEKQCQARAQLCDKIKPYMNYLQEKTGATWQWYQKDKTSIRAPRIGTPYVKASTAAVENYFKHLNQWCQDHGYPEIDLKLRPQQNPHEFRLVERALNHYIAAVDQYLLADQEEYSRYHYLFKPSGFLAGINHRLSTIEASAQQHEKQIASVVAENADQESRLSTHAKKLKTLRQTVVELQQQAEVGEEDILALMAQVTTLELSVDNNVSVSQSSAQDDRLADSGHLYGGQQLSTIWSQPTAKDNTLSQRNSF